MFLYNIYGKQVAINIELPLLQKNNKKDYELKLYVDFEGVTGETISIKDTET